MDRKTRTDSKARKLELINRKVSEINERRRGMKITSIEDNLDRQELRNYMRFLDLEPESVSLESLEQERPPRNKIFYATLFFESLIELSIVYFVASLLLRQGAAIPEWAMAGLLSLIFLYIGYRMYRDIRGK